MPFTTSGILRSFVTDQIAGFVTMPLNAPTDTYKAALFDNTVTPDKDATSANSCYNAGTWLTASEKWQAVQWPQGGVAVTGLTITNPASGVIMLDAANPSSGPAAGPLTDIYGTLLYNDSKTAPADQAVCFNYFGGPNGIASGVLTLVYSDNGLFRLTV